MPKWTIEAQAQSRVHNKGTSNNLDRQDAQQVHNRYFVDFTKCPETLDFTGAECRI
jgi:hypothetical protein